MTALHLLRNLFLALWLVLAMTVLRIAPMAVLFWFIQVPFRVAGTLVVIAAVVLVVHTICAARNLAAEVSRRVTVPGESVATIAQVSRQRGVPPPTVLMAREDLVRPVVIRGWRWWFVVARPREYEDPRRLVATIRTDLRDGTARLWPLVASFVRARTDWTLGWFAATTSLRRDAGAVAGYSARHSARIAPRLYHAPLLLLTPLIAVGWLLSWVLGPVTMLLLPRWIRHTAAIVGGTRLPGLPSLPEPATTPPAAAQPRRPLPSPGVRLGALARLIIALLVTWTGTFQGAGVLPAERIVWPWESGPVSAEVIEVDHTPESDGLLGHLGVRHNSTWRPTVALPDGQEVPLPAGGTTEVRHGEHIEVARWDGGEPAADSAGSDRWRHLEHTSITRYVVMTVMMLGAAVGLSRAFAGAMPPMGWLFQQRLAVIDHDQRGQTGRRRRRRRPWFPKRFELWN